jgi:hypothetical protein
MMPAHSVGFVYVMSNQAMPGVVKVGRTSQLAEDRAKKLHTTGVPVSFDVDFRALTSLSVEVERRAHELLGPYRVASNREFFRTTPEIAIRDIRRAKMEVTGITAWTNQSPHRLRRGDRVALPLRSGQMFVLLAYPGIFAASAQVHDVWQAHADSDQVEIFASDDSDHVAGLSDNDPGAEIDPVPFLDRVGVAPNGIINGRERLVPGDRLLWLGMEGTVGCTAVLFEASCYCQVVGRTWDPKASPDGHPLLLNAPTLDRLPAAMLEPTQRAPALPMPREWAPRHPDTQDGRARTEVKPPPPTYWLPQLLPHEARRKGQRNRP